MNKLMALAVAVCLGVMLGCLGEDEPRNFDYYSQEVAFIDTALVRLTLIGDELRKQSEAPDPTPGLEMLLALRVKTVKAGKTLIYGKNFYITAAYLADNRSDSKVASAAMWGYLESYRDTRTAIMGFQNDLARVDMGKSEKAVRQIIETLERCRKSMEQWIPYDEIRNIDASFVQ